MLSFRFRKASWAFVVLFALLPHNVEEVVDLHGWVRTNWVGLAQLETDKLPG